MVPSLLLLVAQLMLTATAGVPATMQPPVGAGFDFSRTMRVDYHHGGGPASGETVALDRVVNDGAWAGSRTQLVDSRARNAPEREMDALFRAQRDREEQLLGGMKYSRTVGAFEGASYEAKGLYRSEADCIMFTRNRVGFCRVCQRAISRIIDLYSR